MSDEREVWIGGTSAPDGSSRMAVLADRDSADAWIRWKHAEAMRSCAATREYTREHYGEKMAKATTEEMRRYYEAKLTEPATYPTDIESSEHGLAFNESEYDRVHITRERVKTFSAPRPPSSEPTEQ